MKSFYNPGDWVERISGEHQGMKVGHVAAVISHRGDSLTLAGYPAATVFDAHKYRKLERKAPVCAPPKPDTTQVGGDHYTKLAIQPYEYAHKNKLGYLEANVVKYVTRHQDKNGKEDLLKAIHSLQVLIELQYPA